MIIFIKFFTHSCICPGRLHLSVEMMATLRKLRFERGRLLWEKRADGRLKKSTLESDLRSIREQLGFGGEILKLSRGSNESFSWDFYSHVPHSHYVPVHLLVSQGCPTSGPEFCTVLLLSCPSELWDLRCRRFYCFRAQLQGYSGIDLLPWRLFPFLQCGKLIIVHLSA